MRQCALGSGGGPLCDSGLVEGGFEAVQQPGVESGVE